MKVKLKSILYILATILSWIILYFASNALLTRLNLSFRLWVSHLYLIVMAGLIGLFSLKLISLFMDLYSNKSKDLSRKITMKVISTISIIIVIGFSMWGLVMTLSWVSSLSTSDEYVITKDNVKMLALADGDNYSYLGYYEYKNFIFRGNQVKISETYGEDISTFNLNTNVNTPIRTTYYDKDGSIIKELYNE